MIFDCQCFWFKQAKECFDLFIARMYFFSSLEMKTYKYINVSF